MQVINAYVDFSNVETKEASFITPFQARKLATNNLGDQRLTFKKLITNKCVQRHLICNTDFVWTLLLDICIQDNIRIYFPQFCQLGRFTVFLATKKIARYFAAIAR